MTSFKITLTFILFVMIYGCVNKDNEKTEIINIAENPQWIMFGDVHPRGWIFEQMNDDLDNGFVGHLDQLVPELITEDEIYGKGRLSNSIKNKDVGAIGNGEWTIQYLWWNSETQSNWRDGWVRSAILTEDEEVLKKVDDYINKMLSFQDEDGYMGIYAPDLRFNLNGENGELWAQSSLFRVLLGYYEATGNEKILHAIESALEVTMKAWSIGGSEPFNIEKPYAGVGHGLTLVDALDRLYQLTGKQKYIDYAVWLYDDYNRHPLSEVDIHIKNLNDSAYRFQGHGVHTYEHLRALVIAWNASKKIKYKVALNNYLKKLENYITPSGGPVGDEFIFSRYADAGETGYEYCSLQELFDSYSHLLQKTGDFFWADKMEWLFLNAAQGARHPYEHSIAYLKTDNSYSMTGSLHPREEDAHKNNTRYSYSPTHQQAAVCCVPNAGRLPTYYVRNMWLKNEKGLIKSLYGPSVINTLVEGVNVNIEEHTDYPYSMYVKYIVKPEQPVKFEIHFKKPNWCADMHIKLNGNTQNKNLIAHKWQTGDIIEIEFNAKIKQHRDLKGDYYFSYGPLLYALPIKAKETVIKEFPVNGFRNLIYEPLENNKQQWQFSPESFENIYLEDEKGMKAIFFDPVRKTNMEAILIPMGKTILRKITFTEKQ